MPAKRKKSRKRCKFSKIKHPGETPGVDLMKINEKDRIIIMIDYLSQDIR